MIGYLLRKDIYISKAEMVVHGYLIQHLRETLRTLGQDRGMHR